MAARRRGIDEVYENLPDRVAGRRRITRADDAKIKKAVRRALHDSCPWASHEDTFAKQVDGVTLYGRLYKDKYASLIEQKPVKFGKLYYQEMRQLYESRDSADAQLEAPENEEVKQGLIDAMIAMMMHPPNRSIMQAWCASAVELSKSDGVALCKMLLRLEPGASPDQRDTGMAIVQCLSRHDAFSKWPLMHATMRPYVDKLLVTVPSGKAHWESRDGGRQMAQN